MRRFLAIANQKGGVGKTTCAVSLAIGWARYYDTRVLLVDLDAQANSTLTLCGPEEIEPNAFHALTSESPLPIGDVVREIAPGLSVLPASLDLAAAEMRLIGAVDWQYRLRSRFAEWKPDVDVVIMDLPPSLGVLTINGLAAATEVLIPIVPGTYSLKGLDELMRTIQKVRTSLGRKELRVRGILLNMVDHSNTSKQARQDLEAKYPGRLLQAEIPRSVRVTEASAPGHSVFDRETPASVAFRSLLEELQ